MGTFFFVHSFGKIQNQFLKQYYENAQGFSGNCTEKLMYLSYGIPMLTSYTTVEQY
jgi:hypothetical protein